MREKQQKTQDLSATVIHVCLVIKDYIGHMNNKNLQLK